MPPLWVLIGLFMAVYASLSVGLTALLGLPWRVPMPFPVALGVGGPLLALGTGLLVWAFRSLGLGRALGKELFLPRSESHLVTDGIYAYTRNPLYLSVTILFLGWFFILRLTPLALLTVLFFVHFLLVAKWEEKELRVRFGQEYDEYRKRVPLFIPCRRRAKRDIPSS